MTDHRDPSRDRMPTPEELALWRRAMRDVRPLRGAVRIEPPAEGDEPAPVPVEVPVRARPRPVGMRPPPLPRRLDPTRPVGLDRRSWQRLRRGQMPIEGTLDLHGMTQEQAFAALERFLAERQQRGARCLLVVTGRGLRVGGVLRRKLPQWLESPALRERVITYVQARIEHGGEGAFYLLLRRRRRTPS